MSTTYIKAEEVPSNILCKRLEELSSAVTKGSRGTNEFTMHIPIEVDRDADFVIGEAARRIMRLEKQLELKTKEIT